MWVWVSLPAQVMAPVLRFPLVSGPQTPTATHLPGRQEVWPEAAELGRVLMGMSLSKTQGHVNGQASSPGRQPGTAWRAPTSKKSLCVSPPGPLRLSSLGCSAGCPFCLGWGYWGTTSWSCGGGGLQYKLIQWAVDLGRQGLCAKACVGASWPHKLSAGSEEGNREV